MRPTRSLALRCSDPTATAAVRAASPRRTTAAVVALVLLLGACGSGGEDVASPPDAGSGTSPSTAGVTEPPSDAPVEPSAPTSEPAEPATSVPASDPAAVPAELDFSATTVDGASFDARTLAGQDAVFFFWAPSCPICRAEAPELAAVAAEYDDLELVGVAHTGSLADMQSFVETTGLDAVTNVADESGEVWTRFGVTYQYTYAFVDDSGAVEVVSGPFDESELRERFDALTA